MLLLLPFSRDKSRGREEVKLTNPKNNNRWSSSCSSSLQIFISFILLVNIIFSNRYEEKHWWPQRHARNSHVRSKRSSALSDPPGTPGPDNEDQPSRLISLPPAKACNQCLKPEKQIFIPSTNTPLAAVHTWHAPLPPVLEALVFTVPCIFRLRVQPCTSLYRQESFFQWKS